MGPVTADCEPSTVRYARRVLATWERADPSLMMYGGLARRNLAYVRGPFVDAAADDGWDVEAFAAEHGLGVQHVVALARAVVADADRSPV